MDEKNTPEKSKRKQKSRSKHGCSKGILLGNEKRNRHDEELVMALSPRATTQGEGKGLKYDEKLKREGTHPSEHEETEWRKKVGAW